MTVTTQYTVNDIKEMARQHEIDFIRLQFTDLFGFAKNVMIHKDELNKALDGQMMFDGSSIDGFSGVEASDMYLLPDITTFQINTWNTNENDAAQVICDVYDPDGKPYIGCTRNILKKVLREAEEMGYRLNVGAEGEFFLFHTDGRGNPIHQCHDRAGYFDLSPSDKGEDIRKEIILTMKNLGYYIEASHHEVAIGQHEIDFKYDDALSTADKWMTFKQIVKNTANKYNCYASFIPKPFSAHNGNAMHCNQSLQDEFGNNVFYDKNEPNGLSETAMYYIGGLLKHAAEIAAIANPTINSYKRLLPGYEAPTNIAWSGSNRSALIRIPHSRGSSTRIELRNPDPTANPYLIFAVMLKAGLEGVRQKITPPSEVKGNIYEMSQEERADFQVGIYPRDLHTAIEYMKNSRLVRGVLGEHIFQTFIKVKQAEADSYAETVHHWEIEQYMMRY